MRSRRGKVLLRQTDTPRQTLCPAGMVFKTGLCRLLGYFCGCRQRSLEISQVQIDFGLGEFAFKLSSNTAASRLLLEECFPSLIPLERVIITAHLYVQIGEQSQGSFNLAVVPSLFVKLEVFE